MISASAATGWPLRPPIDLRRGAAIAYVGLLSDVEEADTDGIDRVMCISYRQRYYSSNDR